MRSLQIVRERSSSSASSSSSRVVSRGCEWVCEPISQPASWSSRELLPAHRLHLEFELATESTGRRPSQLIASSASGKEVTTKTVPVKPSSDMIGKASSIDRAERVVEGDRRPPSPRGFRDELAEADAAVAVPARGTEAATRKRYRSRRKCRRPVARRWRGNRGRDGRPSACPRPPRTPKMPAMREQRVAWNGEPEGDLAREGGAPAPGAIAHIRRSGRQPE